MQRYTKYILYSQVVKMFNKKISYRKQIVRQHSWSIHSRFILQRFSSHI